MNDQTNELVISTKINEISNPSPTSTMHQIQELNNNGKNMPNGKSRTEAKINNHNVQRI